MALTTVRSNGISSLPAISGANLTTLNASNISSGTLSTSRYVQGGITTAGQFRLSTNLTGDYDPITSWEENDDATYTRIGSAVTQSSGIFSFPSTGIYLINWDVACNSVNSSDKSVGWEIYATVNNSSYTRIARNTESFSDTYQYKNTNTSVMVDVTDVSTHKVKFTVSGTNNVVRTNGVTDTNQTVLTFVRLGDT